jgi:hypothetical protein
MQDSNGKTTGHGARRIEASPASTHPAGDEVSFEFEGEVITARANEPVAVALLAAGNRVFRTMPETDEPRGGYCFVGRCADCLMIIDGQPGIRACLTLPRPGMRVERQKGHGSWGEVVTS